jgi:hypothetical protein
MLTPVLDAEQHEKSQSSGRARLHPCHKVLKTGRASAPECTKLGSLEFFGSLLSSEVADWCKALPRAYWMACGPPKKKRPELFSSGRLGSPPPELPNHNCIVGPPYSGVNVTSVTSRRSLVLARLLPGVIDAT